MKAHTHIVPHSNYHLPPSSTPPSPSPLRQGLGVTSEPDYSWFVTSYKAAVFPNLTPPSGTLTAGAWMEKADVPSTRGNSRCPIKRKKKKKTPQLTVEFHGKVMGRERGGVTAVTTLRSIRNVYLDLWTAGRVI